MMAYYGLPHCGTSANGNGWGADLFASGLHWMNHLTSCLEKVGLAPFVGGNFFSVTFYRAVLVYANEVIRQVRIFEQGFSFDNDAGILDEIKSIGPGDNFLTAESTLNNCRKLPRDNVVWPFISLDKWQSRGCPKAEDFMRKYTLQIMENMTAPADRDELMEKGERFIQRLGISAAYR